MKRAGTGKRRWWRAYLVLVALSFAVQIFWPASPVPRPGDRQVSVTRYDAHGPTAGAAVTINYRESGSGQTLILLHGSPGSSGNFDRMLAPLADHFRVVAVDLPGFGASTKWLDDYSIKAHARYVLALMDELNIDRAHVLGFSLGSGVALHMVELAPQRVASLIFYGGIGVQEGEGSGDYHFEHFKYALGYGFLVVGPELVPHLGLLGPRSFRHAVLRNFWDSDQRPLRSILKSLDERGAPLLILHGHHDWLVPADTAQEHHRIVKHSDLVMFDRSHFMPFSDDGAQALVDEITPFIRHHIKPGASPRGRVVDLGQGDEHVVPLPVDLQLEKTTNPWWKMVLIIFGTFVSEDLTCISVGLSINRIDLDPVLGLIGCFLGIFFGDIGLWLAGRFLGRRLMRWPWIAKRLPTRQLDQLGRWLDRHSWWAVFASRFMPGTRLPLYVSAGVLGVRAWRFILWAFISDTVWTPLIVLVVAVFGDVVVRPFEFFFGRGWLSLAAAVLAVFVLVRVFAACLSRRGRLRLWVRISKLWRWEFWPMWLFYAPLAPFLAYLSLRYRSLTCWTAADPGIPQGGVVGESKQHILSQLPQQWVADYSLIAPGEVSSRVQSLLDTMQKRGWQFPIILKPDAAQRGYGLKLAKNAGDVQAHLEAHRDGVLAQVYHPGPHEAGIFYYRFPDEATGHIFSITDKVFPYVVGDGQTRLEELIWRHPRLRMQVRVFLSRYADVLDSVPGADEKVRLAVAGNHCQGTLFKDGSHLITEKLTQTIDDIAQHFDGFYFGRFDVRYADEQSLKQSKNFAIIELNGVTSESTTIYDPSWSIFSAYGTLFRQWSILYRIGDQNRHRGHRPEGIGSLLKLVVEHYRRRRGSVLSD